MQGQAGAKSGRFGGHLRLLEHRRLILATDPFGDGFSNSLGSTFTTVKRRDRRGAQRPGCKYRTAIAAQPTLVSIASVSCAERIPLGADQRCRILGSNLAPVTRSGLPTAGFRPRRSHVARRGSRHAPYP